MTDCTQNRDPLKLAREGTSQEQRFPAALDPAYAPVNERTLAHSMVFAQAYATFLKYYNTNNVVEGDWKPFFSEDVSVQLAIVVVQDVAYYRQSVKEYFDFLKDNQNQDTDLRNRLDYLFSCCATLAMCFDALVKKLPTEIALKKILQNLIQSQLAPALERLIRYHKGGVTIINDGAHEKAAPIEILGGPAVKFSELGDANLSAYWTSGTEWKTYYNGIVGDASVYGNQTTVFERINYIATHNLFTSIFDLFLKAYARTINEAKQALELTMTKWDQHQPHYALFLAYLRLFEYARTEMNTLTQRHLDFYYREILRLKEKPTKPSQAHLLVELAKHVQTHLFKTGELFKAGKDDFGKPVLFATDQDFVANQAKIAALKTIYRHSGQGKLYASPVANSADGLGAELISADKSWHPFHNKIYQDGVLSKISMPQAEIGFAIASHYLFMAEGERKVILEMTIANSSVESSNYKDEITCLLTSVKGWIEKQVTIEKNPLKLTVKLDGADPAISSYDTKVHGYGFVTDLPLLIIKIKHTNNEYIYTLFQNVAIKDIKLTIEVSSLRTLAVSNDFGPVDTSKPFQPFGASPVAGSSLIIGSKEVFQKELTTASIKVEWLLSPKPYPSNSVVNVNIDFLTARRWKPSTINFVSVSSTFYNFTSNLNDAVVNEPDPTPNEFYNTTSRHGFVRLRLNSDFGQQVYQTDLLKYLRKDSRATDPGQPPVGPFMNALSIDYTASQTIALNSANADFFNNRKARFFHLMPFGQAEQHPFLNQGSNVYLFPQFNFQRKNTNNKSEAEFYIGITSLEPPQNLSLLLQVADGTADPRLEKPDPHIHWSYLRDNIWISFSENDVADHTNSLIQSGIISFAIPRDASNTNTLLPAGMYWIRAAVASNSDAVCRLLKVAAQALEVTFVNKDNDPAFPSKVLPADQITKLDRPDVAVKKITQPFATFGGQGVEAPTEFYTRISERLRHKDRAIDLWDYERLILAAFPQIFKVKCLNHTHYEPNDSGAGIYRELAPGHITVVTIPNQQYQNLRDPLRPYTSLGLLEEIAAFLKKRLSGFVKLHVKNPEFEEIWVVFKVRLFDGFDETFYKNKLQEDITRFLSPWAFPGGGSPSFGGKVYKSVLIDFVEEQHYVDYVTDFQLFHVFYDSNGDKKTVERNEVEGAKAVSILVSANQHIIQVLNPAEAKLPSEKCPCEL
jgi:hypothetical protein